MTDSESVFHKVLVVAGQGRAEFDRRLLAAAGERPLSRDELPDFLLIGLSYLASVTNRAVLRLLADANTAYAAEIQARGLLESLAQVAFVLGKETDEPVGTARQRAICVSLARAREEYFWLIASEDEGKVGRGISARALERVWLYLDMHSTEGCPWASGASWPCLDAKGEHCRHRSQWPCRHKSDPRPRSTVRYTLERLSSRIPRLAWLSELYTTSSLLAHQQLLDRIFRPRDGIDLPGPASYEYRAGILAMALSAYGQTLGWILETYSPKASSELEAWWAKIYKLPEYERAMQGTLD